MCVAVYQSQSQSQELRSSERASKDGMAMVLFSLYILISPSFIHSFFYACFLHIYMSCCVGLRVVAPFILLADR